VESSNDSVKKSIGRVETFSSVSRMVDLLAGIRKRGDPGIYQRTVRRYKALLPRESEKPISDEVTGALGRLRTPRIAVSALMVIRKW